VTAGRRRPGESRARRTTRTHAGDGPHRAVRPVGRDR